MSPAGQTDDATLAARYRAVHEEMVAHYERYVVVGNHWALYIFLAWEHFAACVVSHYLLEIEHVQNPWVYGLLWAIQTAAALGVITLVRARTPAEKSPFQNRVDRAWVVFVLLCWNVAILNVVAGQPLFLFLPVLATLSSFALLVMASFLSRRFIAAALVMCVAGGLIARFPEIGFLLYGTGWLVVLQGLGIVVYRKRRRWQPVELPATIPFSDASAVASR